MTPLDTYLRGPYADDEDFRKKLLNVIKSIVPLFNFDKYPESGDTTWVYAVTTSNQRQEKTLGVSSTLQPSEKGIQKSGDGKEDVPPSPEEKANVDFSLNAHCMILFALDALLPRAWGYKNGDEKVPTTPLLGFGYRPHKKWKKDFITLLKDLRQKAMGRLTKELGDLDKKPFHCSLFGTNDPLTLGWISDLLLRQYPSSNGREYNLMQKVIKAANDAALTRFDANRKLKAEGGSDPIEEADCAFVKLRRLQLAVTLRTFAVSNKSESAQENAKDQWAYFEKIIHRQLAYVANGDPKFDAAELVFALEGALLVDSTWMNRSTAEKVFEALKLERRRPFWRPRKPFMASKRGEGLFVTSAEVANSILRSVEILKSGEWSGCFSVMEPNLRLFATWLLEDRKEFATGNKSNDIRLMGWSSDDAVSEDIVQLWHTSEVLLFLSHYERLLKSKIAEDGRAAAGLQTQDWHEIEEAEGFWSHEALSSLLDPKLPKPQNQYAVLADINENFVKTREEGEGDKLYSMLLYGPPGTGKTTVAQQLAWKLKRPLITITVSDFLAGGHGEIENRAKGLFDVLQFQEDAVILFDEIDQFMLDRNSGHYQKQEDVFKFMTPGMLTKLQNLRDAESTIFILATNYYERIDSAIKRTGRIDKHYLLCLPDAERRMEILFTFHAADRYSEEDWSKELEAFKNLARKENKEAWDDLIQKSVFMGWGDLKALSKKIKSSKLADTNKLTIALQGAIEQAFPSTTLGAYRSRFTKDSEYALEEFLLLIYLLADAAKRDATAERDVIRDILKLILEVKSLKNFTGLGDDAIEKLKWKKIERFATQEPISGVITRYVNALLKRNQKSRPVSTGTKT